VSMFSTCITNARKEIFALTVGRGLAGGCFSGDVDSEQETTASERERIAQSEGGFILGDSNFRPNKSKEGGQVSLCFLWRKGERPTPDEIRLAKNEADAAVGELFPDV